MATFFIYQERTIDIKNPDPKIKIGLGVDPQGAKYKNCLKDVDLPYIQKTNNENYAKNIYSPQKKGIFFARINSSLTLLETSKRALSRFKLPKDLVDKMGLPNYVVENYEADDLIGSVAIQWENDFDEILPEF